MAAPGCFFWPKFWYSGFLAVDLGCALSALSYSSSSAALSLSLSALEANLLPTNAGAELGIGMPLCCSAAICSFRFLQPQKP